MRTKLFILNGFMYEMGGCINFCKWFYMVDFVDNNAGNLYLSGFSNRSFLVGIRF